MRKLVLASAFFLVACQSSFASFHLWQITEVFSNLNGSIQFIDAFTTVGGQEFLGSQKIMSSGHSFTFPANLPSDTAGKHVLLATQGYFNLSGVPGADYNLGVGPFFNVGGDTLAWPGGLNTLTFGAGQLPTDGSNSLHRVFNPPTATTFTTSPSTPANFNGATGTVALPEPGTLGLMSAALILLWRKRRA